MGGLSIWHWLVILAIVLVIFGTKKLRGIGSDVGGAIKSFKQAMKEEAEGRDSESKNEVGDKKKTDSSRVIEGKVTAKETTKTKKKT